MAESMYAFLDVFLVALHTSWILFILTGWIWPFTRRVHLIAAVLTCLSWFVLGYFYGFGYCPFTDWHWRVKRSLGETDLPSSYVNYYLNRVTGRRLDPMLTGMTVILAGVAALAASIALNVRDWRRNRTLERLSGRQRERSRNHDWKLDGNK